MVRTGKPNPLSVVLLPLFATASFNAMACSLQFTSPARGSTVATASVGVSGSASGYASTGDYGSVVATVNGNSFFTYSGTFTTFINFFGSNSATAPLQTGANLLSVTGSAGGCSASDSMIVYYSPAAAPTQPTPQKNGGSPQDPNCTNPVNGATGNKFQQEVDFENPGFSELNFSRYYNSAYTESRSLGKGWRSSFDRQLTVSGTSAYIVRPDGRAYRFTRSSGVWIADGDIQDALSQVSVGGTNRWLLVRGDENSAEYYDDNGRLLSVVLAQGRALSIAHDGLGRLSTVTDQYTGRKLLFAYDSKSRLSTLTDPDGKVYTYEYGDNVHLTAVLYPGIDAGGKGYVYNESAHTSGAILPDALTGIFDESGQRYATYTYDAQGRGTRTEHASGAERYTVSYNGDGSSTVTDPLGAARTYGYQSILGVFRKTSQDQPPGAGCSASSSSQSFDENGNVESQTDFNGTLTTYTYDLARNLETQRVEASGKSEQRTISTAWHSYWRQPVKVAEPKKLTTYTYNGDGGAYCAPTDANIPSATGGSQPIGVVCSRTEQATTDSTGGAGFSATVAGNPRTWNWTYNKFGQVLTADGPRTDVSDLTTYTYYPADDADMGKRGNVATIVNALGHLTQVTAYDLNGRPLTIIDSNGVTTTLAYWPRGWLKSRTIDGRTSTYGYTPWGGLERIDYPDDSFVQYGYDAAHRLISVSDAEGNTTRLTLDAAGNILDTVWKNPDGAPAQTQRRRYDALGRVERAIAERDAVQHATVYGYDPMGNPTSITTPKGKTATTSNDALGQPINMTDALFGQTRMQYDAQGQLAQLTAPNNAVTGFTIDGLGNVTQEISADRGTTNATYDPAGNLLTRTDARGRIETRTWDALNRPLTVSHSHAGGTLAYTWDAGCSYGKGRLCRITDPSGSTNFTYDARGNLLAETRSEGGITLQPTQYAYNNADRLTTQITPSGKVITINSDAAGRITRIATALNGTETALADAIQTDAAGRVTALTLGNGGNPQWAYHQDGSLVSGSGNPPLPPWLMSDGPAFDYAALVAAVPQIAWQQNAWHAVADDTDQDGDLDLFLFFNGANENYYDITCRHDCVGWYAGPDFGNLVYLEKTTNGYVRRPFSNQDDIVPGDIEQMVPLDFNNDGKTDLLLVTNYYSPVTSNQAYFSGKPHRRLVLFKNDSGPAHATTDNPGGTHFSDVTVAVGLDKAVWYAEGLILDLDQDGYPDILGVSRTANNTVLGDAFRYNPTSGTYQPITIGGLPRPLWLPVLADLDRDGRLDLVAQDGVLGLRFFRNLGNGSFSEWAGTQDLSDLVGVDWAKILPADIDNDGRTDLVTFETAYMGESPNQSYAGGRLRWLRNAGVTAGQITFVEQPSSAFEPSGNGEEVAYGGTVGDVNNDGWLDLVLAARNNGSRLVVADGAGNFRRPEDTGEKVGLTVPAGRFAQPVLLDINGDGRADLLSTESIWNIRQGKYLLTNTGSATGARQGISIELTGRSNGAGASGRDAFGARVEVTAGGRTQGRQVLPVMGLSRRLHFGLGEAPGDVEVRIVWPNDPMPQIVSGTSSVNSILRVTQP